MTLVSVGQPSSVFRMPRHSSTPKRTAHVAHRASALRFHGFVCMFGCRCERGLEVCDALVAKRNLLAEETVLYFQLPDDLVQVHCCFLHYASLLGVVGDGVLVMSR